MPVVKIYVGTPENDRQVTVETSTATVTSVFKENSVRVDGGIVQLNGKAIATSQMTNSLQSLNVVEGDSLHVVRKLANA
jgi:hypothetical protein